jgi:D-alanyl-D-alanine carboxypeptidase
MYCMMVASANDAAAVIALHVGGSLDMFLLMMNEMADKLGCIDTHFSNVHGLHDEDTYTTARDICKILDYALENEVFRQMFKATSYEVPATNKSEARSIKTTNNMMLKEKSKYYDERVTGGKTGATDIAGRCLAVTAQVNGMEVIAIVMGAEPKYTEDKLSVIRYGSFEEMAELLDFTAAGFEFGQLFYDGQVIHRFPVSGGECDVAVGPKDSINCVIPKELVFEEMTWDVVANTTLTAPVSQGDVVARLDVWYNEICIASTDLVALHKVAPYEAFREPQGNSPQEQEDRHGAVIAMVFGGIAAVIILGVVGLVAYRMIQVAVVKAKIRRRRMKRRKHAELE